MRRADSHWSVSAPAMIELARDEVSGLAGGNSQLRLISLATSPHEPKLLRRNSMFGWYHAGAFGTRQSGGTSSWCQE
jgi:hypothetical protein